MINSIFGKILKIKEDSIILKVDNFSFEIIVSNPYLFKIETDIEIYTYLKYRSQDEEIRLYGFLSEIERELFLKLISISGIGPKTALLVLAKDSYEKIKEEIDNQNISYISKLPRVGLKTAQKIIIELSGKLSFSNIKNHSDKEMLVATLKSFGYNEKTINKALLKVEESSDLSQMIKQALKIITG